MTDEEGVWAVEQLESRVNAGFTELTSKLFQQAKDDDEALLTRCLDIINRLPLRPPDFPTGEEYILTVDALQKRLGINMFQEPNFGWSYPPGCSGPPDDDYDAEAETFCQQVTDKINVLPTAPGAPVSEYIIGYERVASTLNQIKDEITANTNTVDWADRIYDLAVELAARAYIMANHPPVIQHAKAQLEEERKMDAEAEVAELNSQQRQAIDGERSYKIYHASEYDIALEEDVEEQSFIKDWSRG